MKKKYLIPGIIVAIVLLGVFFIKNIFPFGNDFIAWGDMHAQIMALYYNYYDIVYNGKSFLIDFAGGTASNLLSNFSYYIISPFTPIVLFFERSNIPQAVSLIVLGKIVLSSITCNIFLDKKFDKLNNFYKCFFSVLYALSTYNLSLYIITGWIDVVYLFPLILLGLDRLLTKEKTGLLILTLSLALIFNFYIALMCILFIFFGTFIYLLFYGKENKKRLVTLLGISVILSIIISSIILLPTILQILSSARMGFNFTQVFDSKTGPIIDKFVFLSSTMAMMSCILLLIKNYKINKKEICFIISLISLVGIALVVEPINKMLHFGSYVYYPYRYGFILVFLLIIASCFYLSKNLENTKKLKEHNIFKYVITIIVSILTVGITYYFYPNLQECVDSLTFSSDKITFLVLVVLIILNFIPYIVIFSLGKLNAKSTYICLMTNLIVFSFTQSMIYIKIDHDEENLRATYDDMNYIYNLDIDNDYHIKLQEANLIYNFGSVVDIPTQDFFTSLTDQNMFVTNQKLGYSSLWMDTTSIGGNYFTDFILANKYLISKNKIDSDLYKLNTMVNKSYLYETTLPISKGYVVKKNFNNKNLDNSYDFSNEMYKSFTGTDENIIDVYNNFNFVNLKYSDNKLNIVDKEKEAYMELTLQVNGDKTLYFEVFNSYLNREKALIYNSFDIYINDELLLEDYPSVDGNNSVNLGRYNNTVLNIKMIVKREVEVLNMNLGLLDNTKLKEFFNNNYYDIDIIRNRNKLEINYESESKDILFVPITYLNGMSAVNNNDDVELIKLFDNFIGIKLNEGKNNIVINYVTPGIKLGTILSGLGIVLSFVFVKQSKKLINIDIINNISYLIYWILFLIFSLIFYVVPFISFIFSYFWF